MIKIIQNLLQMESDLVKQIEELSLQSSSNLNKEWKKLNLIKKQVKPLSLDHPVSDDKVRFTT